MQILSPYMQNSDERGCFMGITRDQWAEVNFIETVANQVRGNHYHKQTRELFFIVAGEVEIVVENTLSGERHEFCARKGDMFVVEPYELHTFRTRTDAQWINMLSQALDPHTPDFHRLETAN